jgi:hypothetical protein
VARNADRVDLVQSTVVGQRVSGFIDSRWINPTDAVELQSRSVNFAGTIQGTHFTATAADGSGTWVGTIGTSRLTLRWKSLGNRFKTTFVVADTADFDAAVQVLGDQVAATSTRLADARAATVAAAKARAGQAQLQLKAAQHLAASARAAAGRLSAERAAARRRQHAHS